MQEGNKWDEMHGSCPIHEWTGESDSGQMKKCGLVLRSPWVKVEQWEKGAMEKERERETTQQRI